LPIHATMSFRPAHSSHDLQMERLNDYFGFGAPTEIEVSDFSISGSVLFSELGLEHTKGKLSLQQNNAPTVRFVLTPGKSFEPFERHLYIDACGYRGNSGMLFRGESSANIFAVECRVSDIENGAACTWTFSFCSAAIVGKQYRQIEQLADLADWAQSVLDKSAVHLSIEARGSRIPMVAEGRGLDGMLNVLAWLALQGKVRALAVYSESNVAYDSSIRISAEDEWAICAAYSALRGERVPIPLETISGKLIPGSVVPSGKSIQVETEMRVTLGTALLIALPVTLSLEDFDFLLDEENQSFEISRSDRSLALLSHRRVDKSSG
jgi:hypothetical protein